MSLQNVVKNFARKYEVQTTDNIINRSISDWFCYRFRFRFRSVYSTKTTDSFASAKCEGQSIEIESAMIQVNWSHCSDGLDRFNLRSRKMEGLEEDDSSSARKT